MIASGKEFTSFPRLKNFLIFSFLMLITFHFSCKTDSNSRNNGDSSSTQKVIIKNDFTLLNDKIAADPMNPELLFQRAQVFLQKNNTRQAFEDINKAVSVDSTKAEYYLLMADICFKGLLIQQSVDAFAKAIEIDPKNAEAHLKLAELFLYIKAYPKCITQVNEALKIDKNLAKAYFIKGFAYKENGDTAKALSSFQTAIEINADYYDAYIQLGNIETARKHSIALQYYNNALRLSPKSTEALYNRGLLFQNMGALDQAIEDYNTILKIDNSDASAHFNLGYIDLAYKKDYQSAISHFTDAIRINNQYLEAFYNRGVCYESMDDLKSAIKDYNSAIEIVPTYKLAKDKLLRLSRKSENLNESK